MKRFRKHKTVLLLIISLLLIDLTFALILLKTKNIFSSPKISLKETYIACLNQAKLPKEKGQCLRKLGLDALKGYSTAEIESEMKTISESSKRQWCHEFMHYVGWGLYQKTHSMLDAFSQAKGECDSGMYHGVVEEYINQAQINYDPEKFITLVQNVCEDNFSNPDLPSGMRSNCYHGLGHAFMLITENNLNEALKYCDYLSTTHACYTGTFMENIGSKQVGRSDHPSKLSYDQNNPDYPCNILDEKYKNQCYIYKGISNVVRTAGDFKKSFKDCLQVTSKYQEKCFWGVGSDIPGPHWSTQTAAEKCKVALDVSPKAYEQCLYGAMSFVVQLNLGNPKAAVEFCDVADQNYKDICHNAAGISLGGWVTAEETLEKKCASFQEVIAQRLCQHPNQI